MTVFAAFVLPKIINFTSKGKEGIVEAAATASCFGASALAAVLGLSPIVGAFAAGMAVASSNAIEKIRDYTKKISVIFSPVFLRWQEHNLTLGALLLLIGSSISSS